MPPATPNPFRGLVAFVKNPLSVLRIDGGHHHEDGQALNHDGNDAAQAGGEGEGGEEEQQQHSSNHHHKSMGIGTWSMPFRGTGTRIASTTNSNSQPHNSSSSNTVIPTTTTPTATTTQDETSSPNKQQHRRISVEGTEDLSMDELLQRIAILQSEVESQRIRADFYEDSYNEEKRQREFLEALHRGGSKLSALVRWLTRPCRSCMRGPRNSGPIPSGGSGGFQSASNNNGQFQPINAADLARQQDMSIV